MRAFLPRAPHLRFCPGGHAQGSGGAGPFLALSPSGPGRLSCCAAAIWPCAFPRAGRAAMVGKDVPFPEEIFPRTGAGAAGLSRPPAPRDPVVGLSATAAAGVGSPMPPVRQQPGGLRSPSALLCPAPAARGGASILLIIILKQGRNVKESRRNPPHILPPAAPAALSPSATDSQFAARRTVPLPGSAARPRHCSLPSLPAKPPPPLRCPGRLPRPAAPLPSARPRRFLPVSGGRVRRAAVFRFFAPKRENTPAPPKNFSAEEKTTA